MQIREWDFAKNASVENVESKPSKGARPSLATSFPFPSPIVNGGNAIDRLWCCGVVTKKSFYRSSANPIKLFTSKGRLLNLQI